MAVRRVQLRRGNTNENNNFTGAVGELTVDTQTVSVRVHDGTAGGKDLMRADMSNDSFAAENITIAEGVGANTLTIGAATTTIEIPGNLTVAGNVTQNDTLTVASKLITINANGNDAVLSNNSIGVIYERTKDGNPGAVQDSAFIIWKEDGDYFVLGTASVDETTESDFTTEGDFAYADLYLRNLYAQTSVDVNGNNITSVGQIQADSLRYADANNKLAIMPEAGLAQADAFSINDGVKTYLTINTSTEDIVFGTVAKKLTIQSNDIDLGTDAANDVVIEVAARTGDNDGSSLTIKAGSAADSDNNLGGDLILASGSGVQNSVEGIGGTSSIQFQTKVDGVAGVAERMRIHTDGNVGIGDNAPGTLLQISGADAYLTLKNTSVENGAGGAETKIIFEDHGDNALGQIEVSHQGALDDEFGQMIFSTNNDGGLQTALTIDKDQKATFAGVVSVATSLDMTTGAIENVTSIDLDKITDRNNDGIEIELQNGQASALVIDDTNGDIFLTIDANGNTIALSQATTVSADLTVSSGTATIQAATGADANLYLVADNSEDGGDVWRVQAPDASRTLTFAGENDASDGYVDVLTLTGANAVGDTSATVKGTLIVEGEIQSATDLVFQVDNDNNGNNKFAFQAGDNTEVASLTEAGILTVTGLANLNGGIAVDTNNFTVDGTTGATVIQSTLGVYGNLTLDDIGDTAAPNLVINNTDGSTKFQVVGATGNTTIAGTAAITGITTLDDTLKVKIGPTGRKGITFNSDRGAQDIDDGQPTYDVAVIDVFKGTGNATQGTILWDDDESSFSVTSGKLNSLTQFSVGPIAAPNFTVAPTTGVIDVLGSGPVLTLKNSTAGDGDNADPILIKFQNDGGEEHGRITSSQDGATKNDGKIVFSTGNNAAGPAVQTVLTLDHDKNATFTGNITTQDITASNGTINVGGDGATIVATGDGSNILTLTETTIVAAGNLQVNGDITGDANEAKVIFAASAAEASTITLGGGGTVITAGKLQVNGDVISGSTDGDLTLASEGNLTFHIDTDSDEASLFSFKVNGAVGAGTEVAQIDESGNLQIDGDLTLGGSTIKSNDGTATIELATDGTDTTINKVLSVVGNGAGTLSVDLGANDGNDSVVQVLGRSGGDNLAGNKLILKGGGSTGSGAGGSIEFHTAAAGAGGEQSQTARTPALALSIAGDKSATFEGTVTIKGDLDIQGTGTNTTIDTTNLSVSDKVIELARNADDAVIDNTTNDVGFVFTRGRTVGNDAGTVQDPAVFFWDEADDKFVIATKSGADTETEDFSNGGFTEARLDVGTLNADIITIDDADATSLVIKEAGNAYLTFNTDGEQVEFGKIFTAITGSKIGTLTLADGSITDSGGSIDFGNENLSTSGNLTINTNKFAVAGATGIITLANGATIDNNTSATDLIITETNVVLPSGSLVLGAETDDASTYTIAGKTVVANGEAARAGGHIKIAGGAGSAGTDGSVYIDSGASRVASFDSTNLKTTLHGTVEIANGLDLTDSAITNVTDIALDSITADDANTITVNIKQAGGASAFVIKDNDAGAAIEHIAINATNDGDKTTIGSATFETKATTAVSLLGNVVINDGGADKDFRVEGTGRANALFVDGTQGNVGVGTNTPLTMLQVEGADAYLTLKNSTAENGDEQAETKIIFEDHGANKLGQIEVNHQGGNDDAFGRMVFSTNNNGGLQTALTIDKDQDATFAGDLTLEGGDITLSKADQNTTAHSISLVQSADGQHGHSLTISAGRGQGAGFDGGDLILQTGGEDGAALAAVLTLDTTKKAEFAGNVTINGSGTSALDFADNNITIANSVTNTITVGGTGSKVSLTGDLEVLGGDAVIQAGAASTASLKLHANANTDDGDNWRLLAGTNDTLIIGNDKGAKNTFAALLTLTGNGTATNTSAEFAGNVSLNGGGLTVKNAVAAGHAVITLIADNAGEAVDTWTIDAADDSATITINNNSVPQLTMLGNAVATDGLATFAGDVKLSGSDLSIVAPDNVAAVINIQSSLGTANGDSWKITGSDEGTRTLTFSGQRTDALTYRDILTLTAHDTATSSLATFGGKLKVGGDIIEDSAGSTSIQFSGDSASTTLTATTTILSGDLRVNGNDILNANGDTVITFAGAGVSTTLTATTVIASGNLQVNGDITGDADEAKTIFAATTTEGNLITLGGGGTVATAGKLKVGGNVIENAEGETTITLTNDKDVTFARNITITGTITQNSAVASSVRFKDPNIYLGYSSDNTSRNVGVVGAYGDENAADYLMGMIYEPTSTAGGKGGVFKVFHGREDTAEPANHLYNVPDSELSTLDVSEVRGGSKSGTGNDQAGTNLTISGGASTGDGAGGSIVFKVAEASQGAGGTERLPTTTALTVNASKRVITAGDLAVGGQAVLDTSTLTLGVGADEIAATKSFHKITPDGGNNTVATITGGETGSILILMHSGAGGTLTLTNDANNNTANGLALDGGNITLAGKSTVTLIYTGNNWSLVSKAIVS